MAERSTGHAWAALLGILLLGAAAWFAGQRGLADAAGYLLLEALESRPKLPAEEQARALRKAEQWLHGAFALTPDNPELLQHGGRVYEWRGLEAKDGEQARQALDRAIEQYRASLRIRPAWPYTWLDLAAAKARAQQFDHEFQTAYGAALRFGPWEAQVQQGALQLGLASWAGLSSENREQFRSLLTRMIGAGQGDALLREAKAAGRLPVLCVIAEGIEAIDAYCEQKGI